MLDGDEDGVKKYKNDDEPIERLTLDDVTNFEPESKTRGFKGNSI